jgi:uncharacterized protein YdaU (DUF1376 family)
VNYYPRYPAHYLAATLQLSMLEDGAYTRLMDWYYSNERPIPDEQKYAIARASNSAEKRAVNSVLDAFFSEGSGQWFQARIEEEIQKAAPKMEAARINGLKGGRPRKVKPDGFFEENPMGFENETQTEPSEKLPNPQSPVLNQEQEQKELSLTETVLTHGLMPFDRFWTAYPRRVAKQAAMKAWNKIAPNSGMVEVILRAVAAYAASDQWRLQPEFIPYPASWLNDHRWEDEIPRHRSTNGNRQPSKQLQALHDLENLKNECLDHERSDEWPEASAAAGARLLPRS